MRTIRSFSVLVSLALAAAAASPAFGLAQAPDGPRRSAAQTSNSAGELAEQGQSVDLRPNFVEGRAARYRFWTLRRRNCRSNIMLVSEGTGNGWTPTSWRIMAITVDPRFSG